MIKIEIFLNSFILILLLGISSLNFYAAGYPYNLNKNQNQMKNDAVMVDLPPLADDKSASAEEDPLDAYSKKLEAEKIDGKWLIKVNQEITQEINQEVNQEITQEVNQKLLDEKIKLGWARLSAMNKAEWTEFRRDSTKMRKIGQLDEYRHDESGVLTGL